MTPRPGDFGLTRTREPLGFILRLALALNGDASRWTHAFVVLEDGLCIEAAPLGARIVPLKKYAGRSVYSTGRLDVTDEQRARIAVEAAALVGVPYSFLDYLALALVRYAGGSGWLGRYLQSREHQICSQLVDSAYLRAGVHLFDDGRLPQDVTPGDLARLIGV